MSKKKIKLIVLSCIMVMTVIISFVLYNTVPYNVNKSLESNISYDKNSNIINVEQNSLKVLQLTDLHINGKLDMPLSFSIMKKLIYKENPDLIVFTGDIFSSGCSKEDVNKFFEFINKFKLPYASVLGNHDDETPYSLEELSKIFEEQEYSLFKTGNLTDLYGNYYYDVVFSNGFKYQFIFMDSRSSGFTLESVMFYESVVNKNTNNFLFFHIPLDELNLAYALYQKDLSLGIGEIREEICSQATDVGFFDKVVKLGKTKLLIYGHDHINNAKIKYMGIEFCYGQKSTTSSYNDIRFVGGTVYNLYSDGSYDYKDVIIY